MTKLDRMTKKESAELVALEHKALDSYIGFNLCRKWFAEKADAERFLELKIKQSPSAAYHYSYGAECHSRVETGTHDGKPCFEAVYG